LICTAALLLGVLPARAEPAGSPQAWQARESWERLAKGMSRFDVLRILGEPGKVASYDGFERWEYPDLRGGRVNFDDAGELLSWRAPPGLAVSPAQTGR
jgi:hypothetical protein